MIDLHSHILAGIDDGPATTEESVEMAELYAEAGFSRVVATPHWIPGSAWTPGVDVIEGAVRELNELLLQKKIPVWVFAGMEIAMDSGIAGLLAQGRLAGIAGTSYVLIEAPFQQMPLGWEQVFFDLSAKGYLVIMAHPERCGQLAADPSMYDDIVGAGVFLQVNYSSFLGHYGPKAEEISFYLAQKGYVHCLATDSHDLMYRNPNRGREAMAVVEKAVGAEAVDVMARVNPERVLAGRRMKMPGPVEGGGKKKGVFWKRWLSG